MSVYTELSTDDFNQILSHYDLGSLVSFQGIAAGIENTNYKITVKKNDIKTDYFLTIFEEISESELDFFIPLLAHLKQNNCHVAGPKKQISGALSFIIKDKPAAIFDCLSGYHVDNIQTVECFAIGAELARIHLAAKDFTSVHQNPRGYYWLHKQISKHQLNVNQQDANLLNEALNALQHQWQNWQELELPKGFIHGDLFPDNCLFTDSENVNGVIDFYAGGNDFWAYDLAITILAWCAQGEAINADFKKALIQGYESVRSLTHDEQEQLSGFIQLATLRFWVSRLIAAEAQGNASLTTSKNPDDMKAILLALN